jgi:hypothetical protein
LSFDSAAKQLRKKISNGMDWRMTKMVERK